jgi:DNA invertase Pin-like site-specific DNA recombinase
MFEVGADQTLRAGHSLTSRSRGPNHGVHFTELQDDETKDFIARRGWKLTATYVDHGVSGSRDSRPELDRMLADARRGKFDILVVWKSDRLFRSLRHLVTTLDELAAIKIGFASATEPFDSTTPSGRLLVHLVGAMAEFERAVMIERTKAGLAVAIRRGARPGRPRARVDLERARVLRGDGKTFKEVADELGVGVATLHRAMKTP